MVDREIDHALAAGGPGEIIGCTDRTVRRWRLRFEHYGYEGLLDRRRGGPSSCRAPVVELQRVLRLHRERYLRFNGRHLEG